MQKQFSLKWLERQACQRGKYWGKCIISLPLGTSCKNGKHIVGNLGFEVRESSKTSFATS